MEEKEFIVYKYTNKINGKCYIGQTKQRPNVRAKCGGKGYKDSPKFWNAIQKYGWDNFSFEIIAKDLSPEEADEIEQKSIRQYKANLKHSGYNVSGGGQANHIISQETIEKIRQKKIERDKMIPKRHWTKEQIAKQVEARLKSPLFWEGRKKCAEKRQGTHLSNETKNKISLSHKKNNHKPNQIAQQNSINKKSIAINQYTKSEHNYIATYKNSREAVRTLYPNINQKMLEIKANNIRIVCRKLKQSACGYYWENA